MIPDWLDGELVGALVEGLLVTIAIVLITTVASMILGLASAIGQRSRRRLVPAIARLWVTVFRNVPALILVIFFAFAIPNLVGSTTRRAIFFDNAIIDAVSSITGLALPFYALAACVALTCNTSGHLAEIMRSGLDAVPAERIAAARSLGATARGAYFGVTIPDGLRISWPAISNRLIHNLKNTSLVSFVAVPDLFNAAQGAINKTFQATELLILVAIVYLALSTALDFGLRRIERALWRGRPIDRLVDV